MKKKNSLLLFFVFVVFSSFSQENQPLFSVMFYNVENLFDTINDPLKNDDEFLPHADKKWDSKSFYKKINNISKVIIAAGEWYPPDIIALAEVENEFCVQKLLHNTPLQHMQYSYIYRESPDERGVDVTCIYNPNTFLPVSIEPLQVILPQEDSLTRDILYIKGFSERMADTVHIFICHFPSRFGGEKASEYKRLAASNVLYEKIITIQNRQANACIVIVGDFNDTPQNKSLQQISESDTVFITNLSTCDVCKTHYYKGFWSALDQCLLSDYLEKNYTYSFKVVKESFMMSKTKNNTEIPHRSFAGPVNLYGYSDHLPIMLRIITKK